MVTVSVNHWHTSLSLREVFLWVPGVAKFPCSCSRCLPYYLILFVDVFVFLLVNVNSFSFIQA